MKKKSLLKEAIYKKKAQFSKAQQKFKFNCKSKKFNETGLKANI